MDLDSSYENHLRLIESVCNAEVDTIEDLIVNENVNVDCTIDFNLTPLFVAIRIQHLETVRVLLKYGAKVNLQDGFGKHSPLHWAVLQGDIEIIKELLMAGAVIDCVDSTDKCIIDSFVILHEDGQLKITFKNIEYQDSSTRRAHSSQKTPLHYAACRSKEVTALLLDNGAEISKRDWYGKTPLHIAIEHGKRDIAEFLIDRGANVYIRDKSFKTPLHYAAETKNEELIHLLVHKGPEILHATMHGGCSPLQVAITTKNKKIQRVLALYLIVRKSLNLFIAREDANYIHLHMKHFETVCKEELLRMKEKRINRESNFTYFNLISENVNKMLLPLHGVRNLNELKTRDVSRKFPLFSGLIKYRIKLVLPKVELFGVFLRRLFFVLLFTIIMINK